MTATPILTQFRLEFPGNGLVHLIFDCPGRTMNVFSDAAIDDIGAFARWLTTADVTGVLIRSGKDNAFCAGADLTELGVAYDMIMAAPQQRRFDVAFAHFFRLSTAFRLLETAGKPVAAAIAGLALGGGSELLLATHYRVLSDDPRVVLGLPESLVGLLPGAGGTQRLPRLIGVEAALPILLDGGRLAGRAALDAGLVHELAAAGDVVAHAEKWLLSRPDPRQPWDQPDAEPVPAAVVGAAITPERDRVLARTLAHYPAPLAILDCIEFGLPQAFDGAIRTEMAIFAQLIQREEARNMIQTMFLAKTDYERAKRAEALPDFVHAGVAAARGAMEAVAGDPALAAAGFGGAVAPSTRQRAYPAYWLDLPEGAAALRLVERIGAAVVPHGAGLSFEHARLLDYAIVRELGYPAYLGGPLAFALRSAKTQESV
jgi:3-hydroxyacyl-CoA dehydrogenase/enoyl-CoA hydratase/3-hydroxybutyryl-CoA epimerase